jgi:hypothetical protein
MHGNLQIRSRTAAVNSSRHVSLGELLKAVAVLITGGVKALANQKTEAAQLLLGQVNEVSRGHSNHHGR